MRLQVLRHRSPWWTVAACGVGLLLGFGSIVPYTFSVFLKEWTERFGWTRAEVSFAFTIVSLVALGSFPMTGWVIDRRGARQTAIVATLVLGCLLMGLAALTSRLWHLYAFFALLGVIGPATYAVPYARVIAGLFDVRRGLALGLAMSGVGLGSAVMPVLAQTLVAWAGWRMAYAALAALVLVVAVPVLVLLLDERREGVPVSGPSSVEAGDVYGVSRREGLRSGRFLVMLAAFLIVSLCVQACLIHLVPLLTDQGLSGATAALAASVMGAAGLAARAGAGWLLDRVRAPRAAAAAFSAAAAGMFGLAVGTGPAVAVGAALLIGLGYGAETAVIPYVVSRYFGLRAFGELYSYAVITVPLGGAIGPVLMGRAFDDTGSYGLALLVCAVAMVMAAALMLTLGPYPTWRARSAAER